MEVQDNRRLVALSYAHLPCEWRGKRYRRVEKAANPAAREEAEQHERDRWAKEVIGLLTEAGTADLLPYAATLESLPGGASDPTARRCCRGFRGRTLKKRVSDWRPVRRFLWENCGTTFPSEEAEMLQYFSVLETGQAKRTTLYSALAALRFLEQAGERPEAEQLYRRPALQGAVQEAAAAAARRYKGSDRKKQAPPLLIRVLVGMEEVVVNEERKAFERLFAGFRLTRHWAFLQWDDTAGLAPGSIQRRERGMYGELSRGWTSCCRHPTTTLATTSCHCQTPPCRAPCACAQSTQTPRASREPSCSPWRPRTGLHC